MRKINILVLPSINPKSFLRDGQKWAYFKYWPEGSYHIDLVGAFQIPFFSRYIEARYLKFFSIQALKAFFIRNQYDLIVATGSQTIVGIAFLEYIMSLKKPKLVVFDVEKFGRKTSGLKLHLIQKACTSIDLVIYHCSSQEQYYQKHLPQLQGKTRFLPLGVHPYEKTLGWRESNKDDYLIAFGTPQTWRVRRKIRGWQTLLDAWDLLKRKDITLKIVGQPRFTEREIGKSKVPEMIELHPFIPRDKLTPIVEKAKFALLPLWEVGHAQGQLTLLYLMSLGKAVIVGNTIGVRDYVVDGETGLFYTPGNKEELVQKIEFLLEYPEETEKIGRNAYEVVREKYSDKNFSEETYRAISQLFYE
ncbi:hypothetical protein ES707_21448 [subsurface metagenome]